MGLVEKVDSSFKEMCHTTGKLLTPANLVSVSRPLIAWYGLEHFMDQPFYLSLTLTGAFMTDAIDGTLARYFKQNNGLGGYVDIAADRALEFITLWSFAREGMIPYVIPAIFTTKGIAVDSLRIYRDMNRGDYSKPLQYGRNDNKAERFAYALVKGTYISGIPLFAELVTTVMGIGATTFGLYRGVRSLINR